MKDRDIVRRDLYNNLRQVEEQVKNIKEILQNPTESLIRSQKTEWHDTTLETVNKLIRLVQETKLHLGM